MKHLSFLICWAATCAVTFGAGTWHGASITSWHGASITSWNGSGVSVGGGGGSSTDYAPYLVKQNLEGAGYDNGETWTEGGSGTVDPDYTALVLGGAQSLYVPNGADTRVSFTTASSVTLSFKMRLAGTPGEYNPPVYIYDSFGNVLTQIYRVGAVWHFQQGTTAQVSSSTVVSGVSQYVWIETTKGTGADGVARFFISPTTTKPGLAAATITTGTVTDDFGRVQFRGGGTDTVVDHVRVKAGPAGTVTDWPQ